MSTLLMAVEIANCFDNGGGRVVWQHQPCWIVSVEKHHCMDRSRGHGGVGINCVMVDGKDRIEPH